MESLFGCNSATSSAPKEPTRRSVLPPVQQEDRVLDPKKSQNIAILLRALNVTRDEVSEALLDGKFTYSIILSILGQNLLFTYIFPYTAEENLELGGSLLHSNWAPPGQPTDSLAIKFITLVYGVDSYVHVHMQYEHASIVSFNYFC